MACGLLLGAAGGGQGGGGWGGGGEVAAAATVPSHTTAAQQAPAAAAAAATPAVTHSRVALLHWREGVQACCRLVQPTMLRPPPPPPPPRAQVEESARGVGLGQRLMHTLEVVVSGCYCTACM